MKIPDYPRDGDSVESTVRSIIDYLKSSRITSFPGGMVKPSTGGTTLSLRPKPPEKPAKKPKPIAWEVYDLQKDGETWKCRVKPGHVLCIDPKSNAEIPMRYWKPSTLEADPLTWFTVSAEKTIYCRVNTSNKDIPNAVDIEVLEEDPEVLHSQPPPSAADNGESPPPPQDGVYYYKIADFEVHPDYPDAIRVKDQYQIGNAIEHRPNLLEWWNTESEDGTIYKVGKGWNGLDSRHELRSIRQLDVSATSGVPIVMPFQEGQPPYETIDFRGVRERQSGDDASDATTQIRVQEASDKKCVVVKGNGNVGNLQFQTGPEEFTPGIEWDDGLITNDGTVTIEAFGGKNLNIHIMTQGEGTDPDGWVRTPTSVKTLCWRNGRYVGAFDQASSTSYSDLFVGYEETTPVDLLSVRVSRINGVS